MFARVEMAVVLCLLPCLSGCGPSPTQAPAAPRPVPLSDAVPTTAPTSVSIEGLLIGTWKDAGAENRDTYAADSTIRSEINEVMTIPLAELGFGEGTLSMHVKARGDGRWSLDGDRLTLQYVSIEDVEVEEATLESESLEQNFGADFASEFCKDFCQQFEEELPQTLCEAPIIVTVVSVNDSSLILRDAEGESEEMVRVAP